MIANPITLSRRQMLYRSHGRLFSSRAEICWTIRSLEWLAGPEIAELRTRLQAEAQRMDADLAMLLKMAEAGIEEEMGRAPAAATAVMVDECGPIQFTEES